MSLDNKFEVFEDIIKEIDDNYLFYISIASEIIEPMSEISVEENETCPKCGKEHVISDKIWS